MTTSTTTMHQQPVKKGIRALIPGAVAALALLAAAPSHAMGDAMDNEWLPISESTVLGTHGTLTDSSAVPAAPTSNTRADVRESLATWRAAGLLTPQSEIGDTTETLQRREEFYALQTEVMQAEAQTLAAAQAEQETLALAQLQNQGADPAMLRPSADGQVLVDRTGAEVMVVEIDD